MLGRPETGVQLLLPHESIKSEGGPTYPVRLRPFAIVETYVESLFAAANPHGDLLPETTILLSAGSPGEVASNRFPLTPEDRRRPAQLLQQDPERARPRSEPAVYVANAVVLTVQGLQEAAGIQLEEEELRPQTSGEIAQGGSGQSRLPGQPSGLLHAPDLIQSRHLLEPHVEAEEALACLDVAALDLTGECLIKPQWKPNLPAVLPEPSPRSSPRSSPEEALYCRLFLAGSERGDCARTAVVPEEQRGFPHRYRHGVVEGQAPVLEGAGTVEVVPREVALIPVSPIIRMVARTPAADSLWRRRRTAVAGCFPRSARALVGRVVHVHLPQRDILAGFRPQDLVVYGLLEPLETMCRCD